MFSSSTIRSAGITLKAARVPSPPSPHILSSRLHYYGGNKYSSLLPGERAPSTTGSGNPSQTNTSSPSIMGPRHSPVTPLAPLEYLQNQRRGSITDPSLHAGPTPHSLMTNSASMVGLPPSLRHLNSPPGPGFSAPSTSHELQSRSMPAPPRPASPFRFGEGSPQPPSGSKGLSSRRALRSSSADAKKRPALKDGPRESGSGPERSMSGTMEDGIIGESSRAKGRDKMDVDPQERDQEARYEQGGSQRPRLGPEEVDYSARRHSIAAGTKRKMSSDEDMPASGNKDIDSVLAGPGVSSGLHDEAAGPAPKRRGSAFDTQKIAQLSLYDRRNSVDARLGSQWWGSDRQDAASSSTLASTPLSGYSTPSSAFPGESPHGRPPGGIATFAWPATPQHPDQAALSMQNEPNVNMAAPAIPYEQLAIMSPVSFAPDRRMSAPTMSPENLPTPPSTGPTRVLRSRSRPPSRVRGIDQSSANSVAGPSSAPSAGASQGDDALSLSIHHSAKEPGSTPYSRSPELRVSHKLAERKRRKEMKDLFDELRDQLPADRGMKASKWEILSKAIDFIVNLKQSHQEMSREIELLRHELDSIRHGIPPPFAGGPPQQVVYGHGPPVGVSPYAHPGPPSGPPPQPQPHQHQPHQQPPQHPPPPQQPGSRPSSSQNMYPPGPPPVGQPPNVTNNGPGSQVPRTNTPS